MFAFTNPATGPFSSCLTQNFAVNVDPATSPVGEPLIPNPPVPFGVISILIFVSEPSVTKEVPDNVTPAAATFVSKEVAVTVVKVAEFGAVPPIIGGLERSKVPPSVRFPLVVTVPVKVNPLTVPAPLTEVTVPTVGVAHDGTPEAKVST